MSNIVPNSVKLAIHDCVENAYSHYGKAETTQVQNYLVTDYGILFFDIPLLENLIKEGVKDGKIQVTC